MAEQKLVFVGGGTVQPPIGTSAGPFQRRDA